MPKNAETIPANRRVEIAFGILSFSTLSAAANLYWWLNAAPIPRIKQDRQNKLKLFWLIAKAASSAEQELPIAAKTKPFLLPILLIIFAAKTVKLAVPTTNKAVGKVDKDWFELIWEPTIPLRNTVIVAVVKPNIWLNVSKDKFLFRFSDNIFLLLFKYLYRCLEF